ncbi:MAG TPA: dihydrofolate reductase family protein [Thermaerobacter sp.]
MQQLYPEARPWPDPLAIYDDLDLPDGPPHRPYVLVNMVSTVDGKVTMGRGAIKEPIGSKVDHGLMARLRAPVDAVLRGAGTVRAYDVPPRVPDEYAERRQARGLPAQPLPVVITGSCDLPLDARFFREAPRRPLVLTRRAAPADKVEAVQQVADVAFAGEEKVEMRAALALLRERYGIRRLLSEGGPTVNFAMLEAGVVDELFWTVAPKIVGDEGDKTMVMGPHPLEPLVRLSLASAFFHEGELYLRYHVLD